jgi:hypothetical protein
MWYRAGVVQDDGDIVLTPPDVRVWGRPHWAPSGHLAVGGFVGISRVVFDVDVRTAATNLIAASEGTSYELVRYLAAGRALCRRRSLDGSVHLVRTGSGADEVIEIERQPQPAWRDARLVRWRAGDRQLQGLFVPPALGDPHGRP